MKPLDPMVIMTKRPETRSNRRSLIADSKGSRRPDTSLAREGNRGDALMRILAGLLTLVSTIGVHASLSRQAPLHPHVPNHLLVRPSSQAHPDAVETLRLRLGAVVKDRFRELNGLQVWTLGPSTSVREALSISLRSGLFQLVEPDYLQFATVAPNDPFFADGSQWHLENTGRQGGSQGADISALDGWAIRTDAAEVKVAIIDTGARLTHEDLRPNLWHNPGEIAGNGKDDDQNGIIDDIHGINSIRDHGDPSDDTGHGTHVSGLVGAVGDNRKGSTGVAWNVKLMPLRFLNRFGEGATSDAIQCINYAINNGADIINNSWGSNAFSGALSSAIGRAFQEDVLIVAAAGNERRNNDVIPLYPANYPQSNVLSIAATTHRDALASYSNYGATTVDIAAPGNAILSTWGRSDRAYDLASGSSMSAPIVSGAAALMRAHFPSASASEIAARMIATVDPLPSLRGRCVSEGRLNLALALGPDLVAGFTMSPNGGAPPLRVSFKDQSLGQIVNWHWDFGDGSRISGLPNPFHTYNRAGNFPVTLRVESQDGFSVSRTQSIAVIANYRVELDFFNWVTIDNPIRLDLGNEGISHPIPLPFLFPFYARPRDRIYVGSNGVMGFDPEELAAASNQSIPEPAAPNALIAPYWDDLNPTSGGHIEYGLMGSPPHRRLVVTWDGVPLNIGNNALPLSFQAILEEGTQRIVFQYRDILPGSRLAGGSGATIGLENDGGFLAAQYLFNGNRLLRNEQTIAFSPLSSSGLIVGPERDLQVVRNPDGITNTPEFQLLNTGSDRLAWRTTSDQDWALLSKTQGVLGAGQAEAVAVRINPTASSLAPGSYFANIVFENLSSGTGSVRRRLQLVVNGNETNWELIPRFSLATAGGQGGPFYPLSRIYTLVNDGTRLIDWTATSDASWVHAAPQTGQIAAGASESVSLRFTPAINHLRPGVHETVVRMVSRDEQVAPLIILARVIVQGQSSALTVLPDEPASKTLGATAGPMPVVFEYQIENHGQATGAWTARLDRPELTVHPEEGTLDPGETTTLLIRGEAESIELEDEPETFRITVSDTTNRASTLSHRVLMIHPATATPLKMRIESLEGQLVLHLQGLSHEAIHLEQSGDLQTWTPLTSIRLSDTGWLRYPIDLPVDRPRCYFRALRTNQR